MDDPKQMQEPSESFLARVDRDEENERHPQLQVATTDIAQVCTPTRNGAPRRTGRFSATVADREATEHTMTPPRSEVVAASTGRARKFMVGPFGAVCTRGDETSMVDSCLDEHQEALEALLAR